MVNLVEIGDVPGLLGVLRTEPWVPESPACRNSVGMDRHLHAVLARPRRVAPRRSVRSLGRGRAGQPLGELNPRIAESVRSCGAHQPDRHALRRPERTQQRARHGLRMAATGRGQRHGVV